MAHKDDIQRLITKHTRRLQKLKEQQASLGVRTPPEISTEIEDIEAEIDRLQPELETLEAKGTIVIGEEIQETIPESTEAVNPILSPVQMSEVLQGSSWVPLDFDKESLRNSLKFFQNKIPFEIMGELSGGLSGAKTLSVKFAPNNEHKLQGQYILKVCKTQDAEREEKNHRKVEENPILGGYIPPFARSLNCKPEELTGIFYEVAGGSLLSMTTLQDSLERDRHYPRERVEKIAATMLEWSVSSKDASRGRNPRDVLSVIRQGLGKRRLGSLPERLKKCLPDLTGARIAGYPLKDRWKFNPIPFLLDENKSQKQHLILEGNLHGDLHAANIIIPRQNSSGSHSTRNDEGLFSIIDFALLRRGNALFDLAYFELSIILNHFNGFSTPGNQQDWWLLEEYLSSDLLPSGEFSGREGSRIALPIRRALKDRAEQNRLEDIYWISYLAASVEAGLNFAQKLHQEPYRQCVAFLTAVSRFHRLVELLDVAPHSNPGVLAMIHWPASSPSKQGDAPASSRFSSTLPDKLPLIWPGPILQTEALFDPRRLVDRIGEVLTMAHDQGVLLVGERKSGKTSYLSGLRDSLGKHQMPINELFVNTLSRRHSIHSFAAEIWNEVCGLVGVPKNEAGHPLDDEGNLQYEGVGVFVRACQQLMSNEAGTPYILFIDEFDSALKDAQSAEDAEKMLELVDGLLDPRLPLRMLLTASDPQVLKGQQYGSDFLNSLERWNIPQLSEAETADLVKRLDTSPLLGFEKNAYAQIFKYSGGQIYMIKFIVRAILTHPSVKEDRRLIDAQIVDEAIECAARPLRDSYEARNLHDNIFETMSDIYENHFSDTEKQVAETLTLAGGELTLSKNDSQLIGAAESLRSCGYIMEKKTDKKKKYIWRISFWQLFLAERYRLYPDTQPGEQLWLEINEAAGLIRVGDALLKPTTQERRILYYLARRSERLVSYDDLADFAWGGIEGVTPQAIAAAVSRLRKKLAKIAPDIEFIETIIGQGFILHQANHTPPEEKQ